MEDFLTPDHMALSSVPAQFIVTVFNSSEPCFTPPNLIAVPGETPVNGTCIPIASGMEYRTALIAQSPNSRYILILVMCNDVRRPSDSLFFWNKIIN